MKRRVEPKGGAKTPTVSRDGVPGRQVYVTSDGLAKMKEELGYLQTVRRGEVADLIQKAKEMGDITDSAQYDAAKDDQAFLEGRIRALEEVIGRAAVIEDEATTLGEVRLGSHVTLLDSEGIQETWAIVGRAEANAAQGRISNESPVGRSLIGRRAGDLVEVQTPSGVLNFTIVTIV
ncbi:MAG: transcription elongation factor GreA [Chloroflexi bacterium]|nr:transcription elongation factor GreA [Chloroflexota bacterium]